MLCLRGCRSDKDVDHMMVGCVEAWFLWCKIVNWLEIILSSSFYCYESRYETSLSLQEFLELPRKKFLGNMQEFLGNDVFPENFPGKYSWVIFILFPGVYPGIREE
jgi:hypothetical protein